MARLGPHGILMPAGVTPAKPPTPPLTSANQSRLGTCFMGITLMGLYVPQLWIGQGTTEITTSVVKPSLTMSFRRREPSRATLTTRGTALTPGKRIEIRDGGAQGKILFAGHILPRRIRTRTTGTAVYDTATASGYRWLLDRFALVTKRYYSQPINGIVNDIITNYTDGFTMGRVDSSLGNLATTFTFVPVSGALQRIAASVGGFVSIDPLEKNVSILTSIDDGHPVTLTATDTSFWDLEYEEDLSQVRTRVIIEGQGSGVAVAAVRNASTVTLESTTWATATGGSARLNQATFTYTGISGATLTGCTGLPDGAVGDSVNLIVQKDDAAAQAAMATLLGGGASGIITHYIQDRRLSETEASMRATENLATYAAAVSSAAFTTVNRTMRPFKTVTMTTIALSDGRTISDVLSVDTVEARARGTFVRGTQSNFDYRVTATPVRVTLPQLLTTTTRKGETS
jgi:hypothetical protein